jgi:DNA-binding CsgD family transcriptional regulator
MRSANLRLSTHRPPPEEPCHPMTPQQTNDRLDAIAATLDADPLPARLALLEVVGTLARADRGLLYCVVMREGKPYYVDLQAFGPPDFVAASLANEGVCILDMGRRVDGHENDNILENPSFEDIFVLIPTAAFVGVAVHERFFAPLGLVDFIGAHVLIDGNLAGWAGVYRTADQPRFTRADLARVRANEQALLDLFAHSMARHRFSIPAGGAVGVLDREGRVVQASADAPDWFRTDHVCADLRAAARDFARSTEPHRELFVRRHAVTLTRLVGKDGDSIHARIVPASAQPVPALARLSERQRAVALALVEGATIAEAARDLSMSPETVRSHLKAIYALFGVSTRVELMKVIKG